MDMCFLAGVVDCCDHLCGIRNTIGMRGCNLLIDDLRAYTRHSPLAQ